MLSKWHSRRSFFHLSVSHESTFLPHLRSVSLSDTSSLLRRFCLPVFLFLPLDLPDSRQLAFGSILLPATRIHPSVALPSYPSAQKTRHLLRVTFGLRLSVAGSPVFWAESYFLAYGLLLNFLLLSTPPLGDAVTFSFRPERKCLKGDSHPSDTLRFRAHYRRLQPALKFLHFGKGFRRA